MFDPKVLLLLTPPLLMALTFHEFSHGLVAHVLGDPTPKLANRLTLNPIRHLDLFGTLALFITQAIGWAKPVPINPNYFKNPWRDMALVSVAGPAANIFLAFVFGFLFNLLNQTDFNPKQIAISDPLVLMCYLGVKINLGLAIFNLLPIPPLDGSKVLVKFLPPSLRLSYLQLELFGFLIILFLALTGILGKFLYPILTFFMEVVLLLTDVF